MPEVLSAYSIKLVNSFLLTIFFIVIYGLTQFVLNKKITAQKRFNQINIRLRYLFITIFMIFFIKIWVDGFIQILAFIGFLSAAITITQKDNLMNLIGWLIINWRGLFHEQDYIKIANNAGFVKSIGLLYFTLLEANPDFPSNTTGRIIKIPNGLVARNPVFNFSNEKFIESTVNFIFKPMGKFDVVESLFLTLKAEMNHYIQQHFSLNDKTYDPKYFIKLRQEKPAGYEMVFMFYSKYQDKTDLLFRINKMVVDFSRENPELVLAFD